MTTMTTTTMIRHRRVPWRPEVIQASGGAGSSMAIPASVEFAGEL